MPTMTIFEPNDNACLDLRQSTGFSITAAASDGRLLESEVILDYNTGWSEQGGLAPPLEPGMPFDLDEWQGAVRVEVSPGQYTGSYAPVFLKPNTTQAFSKSQLISPIGVRVTLQCGLPVTVTW